MYFALVSSPENLGKVDRYREIARRLAHPARADRRRGAARWRTRARRSCTSTAGCTRPKSPGRSTRRSCSTTCVSKANEPDTKAILDNVILMLWPTINPGRPADGGRVVHEERRHAVRAVRAAAAVSGIRRPRQQPRRLHAQHDRVARARAHVAAVGAADHLRAPPVGAVSDAHLAAAVLRAGRHRRAVHHVARGEHDRHGDRQGPRGARPGRRHAHGHRLRRVVSGLRRLRAELQEHRRVLDRDRAVPVRDAARLHDRRLPAEHARPAAAEPVLEPVAARAGGGCATRSTTWRRRRCRCSSSRRSTRTRCSTIAIRSGRDQIALGKKKAPYAYVIPQQQRDPVAAVEMLRRLAFGGVRVSHADRAGRRSAPTRFPPAPG